MALVPAKGRARGRHWIILEKIGALLRFFFKATTTSTSTSVSGEDENLCNCNRWVDLPTDLLERLLICLPPRDVVRACSACTTWNSVLLASHMRLLRLPWLLLQPITKSTNPFPFIKILCPNEDLTFDIRLPSDICDFRLSGIMGWLHVSDCVRNSYLLNPLNRVRIPIPYLFYTSEYKTALFAMSETNIKTNSIPCSLKILCNCCCDTYLYVKPFTDKKWTTLPSLFDVVDMIYHQNKFFVLFKHGGLTVCDMNGPYPIIRKILAYTFKKATSKYEIDVTSSKSYMVQSSGNIYQLLVSCENTPLILGAFKLKMDPDEFFLSSHDNIFPAKEEYYKDYAWKSEWFYDDTILDANQIIFLDDRKVIFIPTHVGCGFKYVADHQLYHVDSFAVPHLPRLKAQSQYYYRERIWYDWTKVYDKLSWFMPSNYSLISCLTCG